MKKAFRTLTAAAVCAMLVFAAGCTKKEATGAANAKKRPVIGCTVYYMTEFVTLMAEGIKAEAA